MFGNPWPEYLGRFYPGYPTDAGCEIKGIDYKQTTTLLGLLMYSAHAVAQSLWHVDTSDVRAPLDGYYLPKMNLQKSLVLHDVQIDATKDKLVWKRMHAESKKLLYVWVHEDHPNLPYDDWMQLSRYDNPLRSVNIGVTAFITLVLPIVAFVWSRGTITRQHARAVCSLWCFDRFQAHIHKVTKDEKHISPFVQRTPRANIWVE